MKPLIPAIFKMNAGKQVFITSLQQFIALFCLSFSTVNSIAAVFSLRSLFCASEGAHFSPLDLSSPSPYSFIYRLPAELSLLLSVTGGFFSCILWFVRLFTHPSIFAFVCVRVAIPWLWVIVSHRLWSLLWRSKSLRWWGKLIPGDLILSIHSGRLVGWFSPTGFHICQVIQEISLSFPLSVLTTQHRIVQWI